MLMCSVSANTLWCFRVEYKSKPISELLSIRIRYKTDKWRVLSQDKIFYHTQVSIGVLPHYHFRLPEGVSRFELRIEGLGHYRQIQYTSIPDTLRDGYLYQLNNIDLGSRAKKLPFLYALNRAVGFGIDTSMASLRDYKRTLSLKSDKNFYAVGEKVNIELNAVEKSGRKLLFVVVPGCGAPGTRYIVQKWNGKLWYNYINTWEYKCLTTFHKVESHIYGIEGLEAGFYRLVLVSLSSFEGELLEQYSNIFQIR